MSQLTMITHPFLRSNGIACPKFLIFLGFMRDVVTMPRGGLWRELSAVLIGVAGWLRMSYSNEGISDRDSRHFGHCDTIRHILLRRLSIKLLLKVKTIVGCQVQYDTSKCAAFRGCE
jgi:hypothetical protein